MGKIEVYRAIVEQARTEYEQCPMTGAVPMKWCSLYLRVNEYGHVVPTKRGISICEEINLWTYWQGRNFFKQNKVARIKYLVVGQDWGNPFNFEDPVMRNIIDMNSGKNVHYFSGVEKEQMFPTDRQLIQLFEGLGYDGDKKPRIDEDEFDELFFTNFCLGYRTGKQSGGMTLKQMEANDDGGYFRQLCNLLEPEHILCLGEDVFTCVCEALHVDRDAKVAGNYNDYLDSKLDKDSEPYELARYDGITSKVYGLAHCGQLGMMNRKSEKYGEKGFELQKKDWERIK